MALIEHLEDDDWQESLRSAFKHALHILKTDRFRAVSSSVDDLRSWLISGGINRVAKHLTDQMTLRGFSPEKKAAVNDFLRQLVHDNRCSLLDLMGEGVVPSTGMARFAACGISEIEFRDLLGRMLAGERPFEDWMRANGRSDEDIAEVYRRVDEFLMQSDAFGWRSPSQRVS